MLVLSRSPKEDHDRVIIILEDGRRIGIKVIGSDRQSATKIGIDAPDGVEIWRGELLDQQERGGK